MGQAQRFSKENGRFLKEAAQKLLLCRAMGIVTDNALRFYPNPVDSGDQRSKSRNPRSTRT